MSRFHGLTQANPERKKVATAVTDGCESIKWQVRSCKSCRAAKSLQRFRALRSMCWGMKPHYLFSLALQLNELDNAVNRAAEQPQRFGLTPEEIASRRKWIGHTRKQVCSVSNRQLPERCTYHILAWYRIRMAHRIRTTPQATFFSYQHSDVMGCCKLVCASLESLRNWGTMHDGVICFQMAYAWLLFMALSTCYKSPSPCTAMQNKF